MSLLLYPQNQSAYQNVEKFLNAYGKAVVLQPTGTGKTFIAFHLAEEHSQMRFCWLAPSAYIFESQKKNLLAAGADAKILTRIHFITYAGLLRMEDEELKALQPEYLILDEFHRCGASEWGQKVRQLLAAFPNAKVLGLSATNIRYLDGQRDMAKELFDGRIAAQMSLAQAVAQKLLPAPTYVISLYSWQEEMRRLSKKVAALKLQSRKEESGALLEKLRRSLAQADGPEQIFEKYLKPDGHYLVFCANQVHLKEMLALAPQWFGRVDQSPHLYQAYYENRESFQQFRQFQEDTGRHLKLLYCIDMLNEGIHVAEADGVILLRPTVSPILYLQQIGRALSAAGGKTPVILDLVNNFDSLACVEQFRDEVQEAFVPLQGTSGQKSCERFRIVDEVRDCRTLFEALSRSLRAPWEVYYQAASTYAAAFGNLRPPKNYQTADGLPLGNWVMAQRYIRAGTAAGALSAEQIAKLDAIGMEWECSYDRKWEQKYALAKQFFEEHGHLNIPVDYTVNGVKLGRWLSALRSVRKKPEVNNYQLTPERIAALNRIGMCWEKNSWEEKYGKAKAYYREHGNLQIPQTYVTEDRVWLGKWLAQQRRRLNSREPKKALTSEQREKLDRIGMVWN